MWVESSRRRVRERSGWGRNQAITYTVCKEKRRPASAEKVILLVVWPDSEVSKVESEKVSVLFR